MCVKGYVLCMLCMCVCVHLCICIIGADIHVDMDVNAKPCMCVDVCACVQYVHVGGVHVCACVCVLDGRECMPSSDSLHTLPPPPQKKFKVDLLLVPAPPLPPLLPPRLYLQGDYNYIRNSSKELHAQLDS